MSVDEFAKHFQWLTDEKTIKALERMKMRERANAIARDAINQIKAPEQKERK